MSVPVLETPPGPIATIDGRKYLYFVGTGYLGLQGHPEVIRAACEAAARYGIGSANSRTAFGTTEPVLQVERAAAAMFDADDAFYFASGWMGGNILVQLFGDESAAVFIDEHSHYSLFEAARLAGKSYATFRHRDAADLRAKLDGLRPGRRPWVLSDGVFAATGRIAPAAEYVEVLRNYPGSTLLVDDAHGLGVLGANGRGMFEHFGLCPDDKSQISKSPNLQIPNTSPLPCPTLLCCGTLSKAIGGFGGIIAGSREFIGRIKSESAYFGGASPPPAPVAAASAKAIEIVVANPELRTRLWSNARLLKKGLRGMGFDVDDTPVPIVCLVIGTAENMQRIQRELMARGIAIAYMAAYAGLGPEGGLRLAVFATHTEAMIHQLLDELRRLV